MISAFEAIYLMIAFASLVVSIIVVSSYLKKK